MATKTIIITSLLLVFQNCINIEGKTVLLTTNNNPNDTEIMFSKKVKDDKKEIVVHIPEGQYAVAEYTVDNHLAIGFINTALQDFKFKEVFSWYLSIIIDYKELSISGLPTNDEFEKVSKFFDFLDEHLTGDPAKPNALFVARESYNGLCHLVFYVYDPEVANTFLQKEIKIKRFDREFEFLMERDVEWKHSEWYLNIAKTSEHKEMKFSDMQQ